MTHSVDQMSFCEPNDLLLLAYCHDMRLKKEIKLCANIKSCIFAQLNLYILLYIYSYTT